MRFYHTTQNGAEFKTYTLLTSGIFCLIFSDRGSNRQCTGLPYMGTEKLVQSHEQSTTFPEHLLYVSGRLWTEIRECVSPGRMGTVTLFQEQRSLAPPCIFEILHNVYLSKNNVERQSRILLPPPQAPAGSSCCLEDKIQQPPKVCEAPQEVVLPALPSAGTLQLLHHVCLQEGPRSTQCLCTNLTHPCTSSTCCSAVPDPPSSGAPFTFPAPRSGFWDVPFPKIPSCFPFQARFRNAPCSWLSPTESLGSSVYHLTIRWTKPGLSESCPWGSMVPGMGPSREWGA
jgi:hypothetical protein